MKRIEAEKLARVDPKLKEGYHPKMRSEELALLVGDLTPVQLEGLHAEAAESVVRQGKETGFEYGVIVNRQYGELQQFTSNNKNGIKVPPIINAEELTIAIHHNHPYGDSFSLKDMFLLLSRSEIKDIWVHGHNGAVYSATKKAQQELNDEKLDNLIFKYKKRAQNATGKAVLDGVITAYTAQSGLWQIVMAVLMENDGLIVYTFNSKKLLELAKKVADYE